MAAWQQGCGPWQQGCGLWAIASPSSRSVSLPIRASKHSAAHVMANTQITCNEGFPAPHQLHNSLVYRFNIFLTCERTD